VLEAAGWTVLRSWNHEVRILKVALIALVAALNTAAP